MSALHSSWLLTLVAFGLALLWAYRAGRRSPRWEWSLRVAMIPIAVWGAWSHTDFGAFHKPTGTYSVNLHVHDFFHYYMGSKYLAEVGYHDLYAATGAALDELEQAERRSPFLVSYARDLRYGSTFIGAREFRDLGQKARARFTPARWNLFRHDVEFFWRRMPYRDFWERLLRDAGFNPPPSMAVVAGGAANLLPISDASVSWLACIDFFLLAASFLVLAWGFGPVPALLAIALVGTVPVRSYYWTGGSFFRHLWLFWLSCGGAALARRRYEAGGALLAMAVGTVVFPFYFFVGAMTPLLRRAWVGAGPRRLVAFVKGAALGGTGLLGLSLIQYGFGPWTEWARRIGSHEGTFFTNNFGFKRLTTYAPEVTGHDFSLGSALFSDWNQALAARSHEGRVADTLLALSITMLVLVAASRLRPAMATLFAGSALLVTWSMPCTYYTILLLPVTAQLARDRRTPLARVRLVVYGLALFASAWLGTWRDLVMESTVLAAGWLVVSVALGVLYLVEAHRRPAVAIANGALRKRWRPVGHSFWTKRRAAWAVLAMGGVLVVSTAGTAAARFGVEPPSFLPSNVLGPAHVVDFVDFGNASSEEAHAVVVAPSPHPIRTNFDTSGHRVQDEATILRRQGRLLYTLAAPPPGRAAKLVLRSDTYFRGTLRTTWTGADAPLPAVRFEPRRTMFTYLEVFLPADHAAGPLTIEHTTDAEDIGLFSAWLLSE